MRVVILRHPQEKKETRGTAELVAEALGPGRCLIRTGLSWRNHQAALSVASTGLSDSVSAKVEAGKWAVAYLGSGGTGAAASPNKPLGPGAWFTNKKGVPLPLSEQDKLRSQIEGLVFLDGTWSQAKALWWRNAWLLRLRRFLLIPTVPSPYSRIRHEPRQECVSTAEAVAYALKWIARDSEGSDAVLTRFNRLTG